MSVDTGVESGVFISYAWGRTMPSGTRPLQRRAHQVAAAVRNHTRGFVFLDTEQMHSEAQDGGGLADAMAAGIDRCGTFVCCMSSAYAASANCKAELLYALNRRKKVLFVNVDGASPPWTPNEEGGWLLLRLEDKLWADCRTDASFEAPGGIDVLLRQLAVVALASSPGPTGDNSAPDFGIATGSILGSGIGGSRGGGGVLQRQVSMSALGAAKAISWSELTNPGAECGRGAFGVVRRYEYHHSPVAVKEIDGVAQVLNKREIESLLREAALQAQLEHPYVVRVYGVATDPTSVRYGLVMQLMACGLDSCLASLALSTRLEFTRQIAAGLAYMHGRDPPVVHGDLKPANVLVAEGGRTVALTDFGFAAAKAGVSQSKSAGGIKGAGTVPFMAVELFEEDEMSGESLHAASMATDVFAFGVLGFCIINACAHPYPATDPETGRPILNIGRRVCKGLRPTDFSGFPAEVPEDVVRILSQCWHAKSTERPTMDIVVKVLSNALAARPAGAFVPAIMRTSGSDPDHTEAADKGVVGASSSFGSRLSSSGGNSLIVASDALGASTLSMSSAGRAESDCKTGDRNALSELEALSLEEKLARKRRLMQERDAVERSAAAAAAAEAAAAAARGTGGGIASYVMRIFGATSMG
jgi:serine/threonine protein kinase